MRLEEDKTVRSLARAIIAIKHPVIERFRWTLYSSHATRREAEDRAKTVRKVYRKARIRIIPEAAVKIVNEAHKQAGMRSPGFRKYGVYHP